MKKNLIVALAVMLVVALLAGCAGTPSTTVDDTTNTADGGLKLGVAVVPSIAGSAAATADAAGKADFDVTIAAVLVDGDGIIRDCIIDSVGVSANFDAAGQLDFDASKQILTKNELGENYGMKTYGGAAYEWNEQAAALAAFAVGKSVEDFRSGAVNEAGKANDADLASVATIYLGSYVGAVEKAVAGAQDLGAASGDTLKLAVINSIGNAASANADGDGAVNLNVDVAAITMNGDVITSCYIDALQATVSFNTEGAITSALDAPKTKNELGEGYGMKAYGGATFEWNEQAANFAAYVTGKTAADVAGISVDAATKPAEGTDLASTVTITVGGFQGLIAKAAK